MINSTKKVLIIAQKEFADNLWSPRFISLASIITLIILSFTYLHSINSSSIFEGGFFHNTQIIAVFLPLVGIALGFDTIVKERKSGTLNTLLTHPVYRDSIITGKILGAMFTLIIVVSVAIAISVGTMLMISGVQVSLMELNRILIFTILTYLYLSIFLALGIFTSILTKNSTSSLVLGICAWLVLCVVYGAIIMIIATIATGQSFLVLENNDRVVELNGQLEKLSPIHHFSEPAMGEPGVSFGGFSRGGTHLVHGILDTRYTLSQWLDEYWGNVVVLISAPIILIIMSFAVFLRQDVTF